MVLDQLKEGDYRLVLTDEQRAALNRWLAEYEKNPKSSSLRFAILSMNDPVSSDTLGSTIRHVRARHGKSDL